MASLLSYALTTVSDVKESLGIASSNTTYDNLITRKINQATIQIERYCGRRFKETTYTNQEYNATNIDQFVLKQWPVTATQTFSLDIRDTALNVSTWETIDTQLYFVDTDSGVVYLNFTARGRWKRYRATYSAGYATIPEDLAEACASLAAYYVSNADGSDVGVAEKQEGQRKIRYASGDLDFGSIAKNLGINETLESYCSNPVIYNR